MDKKKIPSHNEISLSLKTEEKNQTFDKDLIFLFDSIVSSPTSSNESTLELQRIKDLLINAEGLDRLDSKSVLSIYSLFKTVKKSSLLNRFELSPDLERFFSGLQEKILTRFNLNLDGWEAPLEIKLKIVSCLVNNNFNLDLSDCNLTTIPDFLMVFLQHLRTLNLSGNRLINFPAIENSKLEYLDLSDNCIEERPDLTPYKALREVNLKGNPFQKKELIQRLKNEALRNGEELSSKIDSFSDLEQDSLIEIAKVAAEYNGRGLSKYIYKYGITSEKSLAEIAQIAAAQSARGVAQYLDNYNISDSNLLFEVLKTAIRYSDLDVILKLSKSSLDRINQRDLIILTLSAFAFSLFRKKNQELESLYPKIIELIFYPEVLINTPSSISLTKSPYEFFRSCLESKQKLIYSNEPEFDKVVTKLSKFRGKELLGFLFGTLICEWRDERFQEVYKHLTERFLVPRIIPSILPSKWIAESGIPFEYPSLIELSSFFKKHRSELKENTSLFLSDFLFCVKKLELLKKVSSTRKIEIIGNTCKESDFLEEKLRLISYFAVKSQSDLLNSIPLQNPIEELSLAYKNEVLKWFPNDILQSRDPEELIKMYEDTFGNSRLPYALEIYESTLFDSEASVQNALKRFVVSVVLGNFKKERCRLDNNIHLKNIHKANPGILEIWKSYNFRTPISINEDVLFTQDWEDLFLCGTEVVGSCQRIDGAQKDSKCLLAYCLDGKNGMVAIKDQNSGKILARSMLRLLWDPKEEKPVLFLDRIYPLTSSEERRNVIINAAKECASDLGLELFEHSSSSDKEILALGGPCPYEYADAAEGVMAEGKFRVLVKKIES